MMLKKGLMIMAAACLFTAAAVPAFAASQEEPAGEIVCAFEAFYAGSGESVRPDPPVNRPAAPVQEIFSSVPDDPSEEAPETPDNAEEDFPYDLESFAAEVLRLTNKARAEKGLDALNTDPVLTQMAQARMEETGGKLTHIRPDGSTPDTIFQEYDTSLVCTGEIIISTSRSPQSAVDGFLSSPSHRANLLNSNHQYVGIGVAWGETPAGPGIAVLELFAK